MPLKYRFLLLILCSFNFADAQEKKVLDSLFHQLDDTKIDTMQMHINSAIGLEYIYKNYTKAISYCDAAKNIAHRLNRVKDEAINSYYLGYCYLKKANYDKSLDYNLQALKLYEKLNDKNKIFNLLISIGVVYSESKNQAKSADYIKKAKLLVDETKDSMQLMQLLNQQGDIYTSQQKLDSALQVIQQALQIAKNIKDTYYIAISYMNIGLTYKKQMITDKAIIYLDSAKNIARHIADNNVTMAAMFNNIGCTYTLSKQYNKAIIAFDSSMFYCDNNDLKNIVCENYKNLSELYLQMDDMKQYAQYLNKYYLLKDSIFNNDIKSQMTELESDYLLNKKDIELYKSQAQVTKQKNQRNILLLIATAVSILLSIGFAFYKRLQSRKKLLEYQNTKINSQNTELGNLNQLKDRLFSIISHDLRNPLNTLRSYLILQDNENIAPDKKVVIKNQTINAVGQTENLLDNLLTWANMQIKNTSAIIVPVSILEIIEDILHIANSQAAQKQIEIKLDVKDTIVATDENILSIAVRNIITNAIKFSYANSIIQVFSTENEGSLFLHIQDFGVGISAQKLNEINSHTYSTTTGTNGETGSGLGLFLVKELLQKINTPIHINSIEGKGSEFVLQLTKMG